MKLDIRERARARFEANRRAGPVGIAHNGQRRQRLAMRLLLLVGAAIAVDRQNQVFRQCVYDGDADAVQAAGYFVGIVVKLTTGVQDRHDDLRCRAALFGVQVDRYAAAIVADRHGLIRVNRDRNYVAMARQGLVDRIVDNLKNHVVETGPVIGVSDVHSRPFSDGFKAL